MLVARTRWLDGHLFWREGQVVWTIEENNTVPEARELSRTQKCLNKIEGFPQAATVALRDAPAWLIQQREKLELAKQLRKLSGKNVTLLAQEARRRNPAVAGELSQLLVAEALCCNLLPAAPSQALIALGSASINPLQMLLREDVPQTVCILAALVLGAISRVDSAAILPPVLLESQVRRAFQWSREHGFPSEAALVAALFANEKPDLNEKPNHKESVSDDGKGGALAERCLQAVKQDTAFGLPVAMLREMLADGLSSATVTELAEAAQAAEPIAQRLLNVRMELPDRKHRQERQAVSEARRTERQRSVQSFADLRVAYALASRDPQGLRLGAIFLHKMLDIADQLTPHSESVAAVLSQMLEVMQMGLELPLAMQRPFWELLVERQESFWDRAALASGDRPRLENNRVRAWLHEAQTHHISPLCKLLATIQDKAVVAAALDRGIAQELAQQAWTDPDFFRLFISLAGSFDLSPGNYFRWKLIRVLDTCSSASEARLYFQQLLTPLQACPVPVRIHVLETVWSETGYTRQALHGKVPRLLPFFASLAQFAEQEDGEDGEWCCCGTVIEAALALVQAVPDEASSRITWLLSFLSGLPGRKSWTYQQDLSFRIGMLLAASLAADDANRFQQAVQTAAHYHFRQDLDHVQDGLRFVGRIPALRGPLAHIFPQQPQRVVNILVRLGLTTRLGTDVLPLLARLEPQVVHGFPAGTSFPVFLRPDASWWKLHQQMPEFTRAVNAFLHAQWLIGQAQDVPPGVRRALDKPQRTAQELAHLEGMLTAAPSRTDLTSRATKLRGLLADKPQLAEAMRTEVSERLPHASAEAQAAAIERQVQVCYRARLEVIAGPLPPNLILTDDLINAVLLSVDVTQNRKLLLRLIRASLSRENDWRERHPANKAFLELMAKQGMNTQAWLSKFPRRYFCETVPGKWLHLCLEQDPLHILQMGNHFDTCLSFGGINAFSTVANACELNKRVIYARDHAGNVVGRKLIGINEEEKMIGFHTYCSLTENESNAALRAIFQSYAASFALRCCLTLSETGSVPTLLAENWYDDGAVEWNAEEHFPNDMKSR